jgi:hypothetical protein
MRAGARCGLALACALYAARDGAVDYEVAVGHSVVELAVLDDGGGTVIAGRIKEDAPPGIVGLFPFEGRWLPFVARLDGNHRVTWIRELSIFRSVPRLWRGTNGTLWMETEEGRAHFVDRIDTFPSTLRVPRPDSHGCAD